MNWTLQRVLQQYLYMRRGISLSHELDVKSSMCDEEWRRKHWEDNLTLNMKSTKLIDCAGGKVEVWSQYINHESNVYRKHTSRFLSQGFCTPVRYGPIERTFFHVTFRIHVCFDAGKSLNSVNRHSLLHMVHVPITFSLVMVDVLHTGEVCNNYFTVIE